MAIYGYARVSTDGQTLEGQTQELKQAGAIKIFSEKMSGAKSDRQMLAKALAVLESGDVLLVTRLDRLARSTKDLLTVLDTIAAKQAGFKSLKDQWADTTTPHGKLLVTILAGFAEFERSLILARTNEGRVRAKANGVKFGRKVKLTDYQRQEATKLRSDGKSLVEIGQLFKVSYQTVGRCLGEF